MTAPKLRAVILWPFEAKAAMQGKLGAILRPTPLDGATRQSNSMKVGYLSVAAGTHLSVRESWRWPGESEDGAGWIEAESGAVTKVRYHRATQGFYCDRSAQEPLEYSDDDREINAIFGFRAPSEMPAWATQQWLEVVGVERAPFDSLSIADWHAAGMGSVAPSLSALVDAHRLCPNPHHIRPTPDRSRDEKAYAPWQEASGNPQVAIIRLKPLRSDTYAWCLETHRWLLTATPSESV